MKYTNNNKPLQCFMTQSTWYKQASETTIKGVLWHSTGVNNPNLKRYVQPDDNATNKTYLLNKIGTNSDKTDWNHMSVRSGVHAFIGKLANGEVTTVQVGPWNKKAWGCGSGDLGSCNNGWIQFEICEDSLSDKDYFNKVYQEGIELTAYLCKLYNINPNGTVSMNGINVPTILCHADSHSLKLGSNHADIYHWFNKYGKTMNNVRNDVVKLINTITSKGGTSMGFTARTTRPTSGNKYYIRKANGGYSTAIAGKCKTTGKPDAQCNVLPNCVGYAVGRFNEIGGYNSCKYLSPVNAENFPEYAKGLTLGAEPKVGAVIVWQKGATLKNSDGAGHVAIVEKVNTDGSILISESGYNCKKAFWTETIKKGDGNWRCSWMTTAYKFRCFIYNPAVSGNIYASPVIDDNLRKGKSGNSVKILQQNLITLGYTLTTDGVFGIATETAIKDFQQKNNLTVDGIVGTITEQAIIGAVKIANTRPTGVNELKFLLNNKEVSAWSINKEGTNYIRMRDLQTLGIVKSVSYNSNKNMPEVITQ